MSAVEIRNKSLTTLGLFALLFTAIFFVVFLLQWLSGAYATEFSGYPDEPAHYVTSLMVRDFLLGGNWSEPIKFASDYYSYYPKVAFGHWPPLLYVLQGVWMILFSVSRTSVLIELALTTTVAAFLLFLVVGRYFGRAAGVASALLLVCLPEIQIYSAEEMAESLLLVFTFQASVFFCRYLERNQWRDSLWFAVFASFAILTKGNGWALVMVPPIAIILTQDWQVLRRPSLWVAVPVVAALCLPWQLMTMEMAQRGWTGGSQPSLQYTLQALSEFAVITKDLVGWAITVLAGIGVWSCIIVPFRSKKVGPLFAVMLGLIVSMWVFHSVVPAGVEERKMVNALPAILVFAVAGGRWLAGFISETFGGRRVPLRWSYAAVAMGVALLFAAETFTIPKEKYYGYTELSGYIESRPELRNAVILVSSERDGEGLLVSELAMQDRRPGHRILRASKVLSASDWTGQVSRQFCNTPGEVMDFLQRQQVSAVVLDTFPQRTHYQHNDLILEAIRDYPSAWRLKSTFSAGKIRIYEFKRT